MNKEIENTIDEALLAIEYVTQDIGCVTLIPIATKLTMLTDIVSALCTVDSANLSVFRAVITDTLDSRGYGMTDECEVCGVYINRSANDLMYDTVPLCANHIAIEQIQTIESITGEGKSAILEKIYSMMSNEDKSRYFDAEKREEYYNRYVLGKGDDE